MQIIGALIILAIVVQFGPFLLGLGLISVVIWLLIKFFSSKENTSDTTEMKRNSTQPQYSSPRSSPIKKGKRTDSDNFWNGPGQSLSVFNYTIPNGFVYVGSGLKAATGYGVECALIDPQLPINNLDSDYRVRRMNYWPSYSETTPESRGAYLKWLSSGKNDPEADIGYVFLYFYGLERRLLHDIEHSSTAKNELNAIIAEIERLLGIYGNNGSFNSYANSLLAYVKADEYLKSKVYQQPAPVPTYHMGYPLELKVGLGQIARDGVFIPSDWALSWYLSTPNPPMFARTAAQRCKEEFLMLFAEEYGRTFGAGLKLLPNKTKLAFNHQPASRSLLGSKAFSKTLDIPDVTVLTSQVKKLAPLVQTCHDRLDSYSRFLGRNPDRTYSLDALLELPVTLWPNRVKQVLSEIKMDVSKNQRPIEIKLSTFLTRFPEWKDKSKKRMGLFLDVLSQHYNIGMEPDCRFGGVLPESSSSIVLFSLDANSQSATFDQHYAVASLAMYLSVLVSQVDGKVSEDELEMLLNQADKWLYLKPAEQQRLKAHVLWLSSQDLSMSGVKKRIETLDSVQKEMIGNIIIQVSQVDGSVPVDEMKLIERIFKLLGINSSLYSKMHQAAIEPISVVPASTTGGGYIIPAQVVKPVSSDTGKVKLDMSKVAALQADTEKVTSILSTIFSEHGSSPETIPSQEQTLTEETMPQELVKNLMGLPPALSELVQTLLLKQMWNRNELKEIAEDRGLMLEGALEQINEAAYEKFDQLFAEGDDMVEINQEIAKVIRE